MTCRAWTPPSRGDIRPQADKLSHRKLTPRRRVKLAATDGVECNSYSGRAMRPEWLKPSDAYGWGAIARNVLPLFLLFCVAPLLAQRHAFAPWLLAPAIGLFLYRITVVMHDCTHHTLFESRKLNRTMGLLLGAISGVDFNSFRQRHWQHHESYGRTGDPQGFQYLSLKGMSRGELRWHFVKPLLGLNLRDVLAESIVAPGNIARTFRNGELAMVVLVQFSILALVTQAANYPVLAVLPALSGATFGLFFSQLRGIAEHAVVGENEAYVVRSHVPSTLDRIFLYDVNFNYHAEHHAHPQIPSCHLPSFHRAAGLPETRGSMFDTLRALYDKSIPSHV